MIEAGRGAHPARWDDRRRNVPSATRSVTALALVAAAFACACNRSPAPPKLVWLADEEAAYDRARKENKLVLVEFAATWAGQTGELEHNLAAPEVAQVLSARYILLRLDVSNATDADEYAKQRFKVTSVPQLVVTDGYGIERGRLDHVEEPAQLRALLERL